VPEDGCCEVRIYLKNQNWKKKFIIQKV
jgi:hypothetical protein